MEVYLLKPLPPLGDRGDRVRVKPGYARNYLFPRKLAVPATDSNLRAIQEEDKILRRRDEQAKTTARELAAKMADVSCTIPVQVAEEDRLYGSVTSHDIAAELKKQGFEIDKKQVLLAEPVKKLGVYTVPIRLHTEVEVPIKVWVVKE